MGNNYVTMRGKFDYTAIDEHDKFYLELKRRSYYLEDIYNQMQNTLTQIEKQSGYEETDLMKSNLAKAIQEVEDLSKDIYEAAQGLMKK